MTLLDFTGQVACTVFLGGCEFRCPFCHNADLLDMAAPGLMDDEELLAFLKGRTGLLDGVAFTGGEPLLRRALPDLLERVRQLGYKIKVDTNGDHPDRLREIVEAGLVDYVAMDVKNSRAKYAVTIGLNRFDTKNIEESIDLLKHADIDYEFRTTVVHELHEDADFEEIGQMISGAKRYFLQCFTDRDTVPFGNLSAPSPEDLERYAEIVCKYVPNTQIRGVE
jgi:pyruvate formate lyase activating enzyme